ncbi:ABC transporter permease [Companilactobacillus mishanensis]|uniref:Lantibiotic ABC transporter permease n=1 Tax=Companilactobacillus mishanensis TaxID=2486008 RepID=A0ABW9P827_9LACO|nr:ABC transporter permease [Companilactobacillus mishanensis]MQS45212.1 hypothetical protein [Companilactobacillus mishanensis]
MTTLIGSEFLKIKRIHLFYIILIFDVVSFCLGATLYFANQKVFDSFGTQWDALWGETGQFYSQIFFPILISIIVSVICNIENNRKNWQRLAILPVSSNRLVINKFIFVSILTGISQLIFIVFYYLTAFFSDLPINTNILVFILWGVLGWLGTLPIIAIQLSISIKLQNFVTPVIIATGMSILSFVILLINDKLLIYYPYALVTAGMRIRSFQNFTVSELLVYFVMILLFSVIGLWTGKIGLKKQGF